MWQLVAAERARSANCSPFALRAEREFLVDDRAAECAFGGVVGRLDAVDGGEGPERGPT